MKRLFKALGIVGGAVGAINALTAVLITCMSLWPMATGLSLLAALVLGVMAVLTHIVYIELGDK